MPLILATDADAAALALPVLLGELFGGDPAPAVLLLDPVASSGLLESALRLHLPELVAVEVGSPRFARLNFGAVALVAVDLSPTLLLSAPGRRLMDALGGLLRDGLTLLLVGDAAGLVGSWLAPVLAGGADEEGSPDEPLWAGLGLLPSALVLPAVASAHNLRALLARLSSMRGRLLALESPAAVRCDLQTPVQFTLHGAGSALLVAFAESAEASAPAPVARLHPLRAGEVAPWPA